MFIGFQKMFIIRPEIEFDIVKQNGHGDGETDDKNV
jgi:hypothetical protein